MKFLNNRKGTLTFLLIALLVVSCFWIIKTELRAASLQSRLDEHHSELKNNSDELVQLKKFHRKVGDNFIHISKALLQLGTGPNTYLVFNEEVFNLIIGTGDLEFKLAEYKHYKIIELINENSKIILKDGNIEIKVADDKSFGYDKDKDRIYMTHKGSKILVGNMFYNDGTKLHGISLNSDYGTQLQILDKGIFLAVPGKDGDLNSAITLIKFENGNIDIEADGDINITSKNGKVNINGKR